MSAVETYILFVAPVVIGLAGLGIYLLASRAGHGDRLHPGE